MKFTRAILIIPFVVLGIFSLAVIAQTDVETRPKKGSAPKTYMPIVMEQDFETMRASRR